MSDELSEIDVSALVTKRRRRTIEVLQRSATPLSAAELATRIGDSEYENPTAEEVEKIHLTLYHNHLPRLDDADIVKYDVNEEAVSQGRHFEAAVCFLEKLDEADLPSFGE